MYERTPESPLRGRSTKKIPISGLFLGPILLTLPRFLEGLSGLCELPQEKIGAFVSELDQKCLHSDGHARVPCLTLSGLWERPHPASLPLSESWERNLAQNFPSIYG